MQLYVLSYNNYLCYLFFFFPVTHFDGGSAFLRWKMSINGRLWRKCDNIMSEILKFVKKNVKNVRNVKKMWEICFQLIESCLWTALQIDAASASSLQYLHPLPTVPLCKCATVQVCTHCSSLHSTKYVVQFTLGCNALLNRKVQLYFSSVHC